MDFFLLGAKKMVNKHNILLSFFLILLLIGCTNKERVEIEKKSKQVNVSTTIKVNDESFSEVNNSFIINTNEFSPEITLINNFPIENRYRLFVYIDYKMVQVSFENKKVDFIDLDILKNSTQNITINIPSLAPGSHDLLIVSVKNPSKFLVKDQVEPPGEFILGHRGKIVVNEDTKNSNIQPTIVNTKNSSLQIPFVFTKSSETRMDNIASLVDNSKIEEIWYSLYMDKPNTEFILIGMLNSHQIKLEQPYIKTNSIGTFSMPINIKNVEFTTDNIKQNLVLIAIPNPYKAFDEALWDVLFTNKVTIE